MLISLTVRVPGLAMDFPDNAAVADQDGRQRRTVEGEKAEEVVGPFVPGGREGGEGHALVEAGHRRVLHHPKDCSLQRRIKRVLH